MGQPGSLVARDNLANGMALCRRWIDSFRFLRAYQKFQCYIGSQIVDWLTEPQKWSQTAVKSVLDMAVPASTYWTARPSRERAYSSQPAFTKPTCICLSVGTDPRLIPARPPFVRSTIQYFDCRISEMSNVLQRTLLRLKLSKMAISCYCSLSPGSTLRSCRCPAESLVCTTSNCRDGTVSDSPCQLSKPASGAKNALLNLLFLAPYQYF